MSADNWTLCPKCGKDLREDYDIGIREGRFEVEYLGECLGDTYAQKHPFKGCGFVFMFNHKEEPAR